MLVVSDARSSGLETKIWQASTPSKDKEFLSTQIRPLKSITPFFNKTRINK